MRFLCSLNLKPDSAVMLTYVQPVIASDSIRSASSTTGLPEELCATVTPVQQALTHHVSGVVTKQAGQWSQCEYVVSC